MTSSYNYSKNVTLSDKVTFCLQYAIFLLVIIIVQVVLAVLMFTYADTMKEALVKSVNGVFDKRATDPAANTVFNNIQQQVLCLISLFIISCTKYITDRL